MSKKIKMIIYEDGSQTIFNTAVPAPPVATLVPAPVVAPPAPRPRNLAEAVQAAMADGRGYRPQEVAKRLAKSWLKDRHKNHLATTLNNWSKVNRNGIVKEEHLYYYVAED